MVAPTMVTNTLRFMEALTAGSGDGDDDPSDDSTAPAEIIMFALASFFVYFFCCFPIACKCLGNRRRRSRARLRDRSNASSRTKEEVLLRSEEEVMKVLTVHNVEKDYVGRLEPCIICLDEYKEGDEVCSSVLMHDDRVSSSGCESDEKDVKSAGRLYNCKHSFHRQCILQWLRVHDDCPVCRRNLINLELGNNNIADGSSVMADDNSCSSGSATLEEYAQDEESNHIDRLLTISLGV